MVDSNIYLFIILFSYFYLIFCELYRLKSKKEVMEYIATETTVSSKFISIFIYYFVYFILFYEITNFALGSISIDNKSFSEWKLYQMIEILLYYKYYNIKTNKNLIDSK